MTRRSDDEPISLYVCACFTLVTLVCLVGFFLDWLATGSLASPFAHRLLLSAAVGTAVTFVLFVLLLWLELKS